MSEDPVKHREPRLTDPARIKQQGESPMTSSNCGEERVEEHTHGRLHEQPEYSAHGECNAQ